MSRVLVFLQYLFKGRWTTTQAVSPDTLVYQVKQPDFNLDFYCQEVIYVQHYARWFIPDQVLRVYRYSTRVFGMPPDHLKDVANSVVYFPDTTRYLNRVTKQRHLLNLYLDLLNLPKKETPTEVSLE